MLLRIWVPGALAILRGTVVPEKWAYGDATDGYATCLAAQKCSSSYDPVCGDDSKTYVNECTLKCTEGVMIAHRGECGACLAPNMCCRRSKGGGSSKELKWENHEPKLEQEVICVPGQGRHCSQEGQWCGKTDGSVAAVASASP
jgi:hypothetical protein